MTRRDFADAVADYCTITEQSVTSWGRTHARNVGVGGVLHSGHLYFRGADVVDDTTMQPHELERVRKLLGPAWTPNARPPQEFRIEVARRLGLKLVIEEDHDHLQPLDWQAG